MKRNRSLLPFCMIITLMLFVLTSASACSEDQENGSASQASSEDPNALIYISEYVEGSNNNKYIELYNPRSVPFDLSGWSLQTYTNGASSPNSFTTLSLNGRTIPAKSTFIIGKEPAGAWTGTADITSSGEVMNFNGNDAIGLFNGSTRVDIVGEPGSSTSILADKTLVRRPGKGPAAAFNFDDWYILGKDVLDHLGTHDPVNGITVTPPTPDLPIYYPNGDAGSGVYISEYFNGQNSDKYIEIFNQTSSEAALSDYRLLRIDADNATGATNAANSYCVQLSGKLYPWTVCVVISESYNAERLFTWVGDTAVNKILDPANNFPKGICFFGGNDPVYLIKDGKVIDAVGAAATATNWGNDNVLIRKANKLGKPVWDKNDWQEYPVDYQSGEYATIATYWGGWHDPNTDPEW